MNGPGAPHRLLIAGGGIAGVEALMAVTDLAGPALDIEVVCPRADFVLRPQLIAAPWGGPPLRVDLADLCHAFGARFRQATLHRVERDERLAITSDGVSREYDTLLVATGATPGIAYSGVRTVGFGGLPAELSHQAEGTLAVVVPPGTGWTLPAYQLALLAAGSRHGAVRVITSEAQPLEAFGWAGSAAVASLLAAHEVTVETLGVTPGDPDACDLADQVIALPILHGPRIAGLPFVGDGFLPTTSTQQVRGCTEVYAAGDVTAHPIKQGGLAAHQAEHAATEIARLVGAAPPDHAEPPTLRGKLVAGTDTLYLRRELEGEDPGTASDEPLWRPEAAMVAWRLSRWLTAHGGEIGADALGPIARALDA